MISLRFEERTEKFRHEFSGWLKSNPPPTLKARASLSEFVETSRKWQRELAQERWIGVHWPEPYGGRGLTFIEEAVGGELLAQAGSPQLINLFGLTMVGPVLLKHGSEAQRSRYLSKILAAEELWCQGFSEPEAGSDLASLRTIAERDEAKSGWRITGQKVWTSFAQYADWCFALVRTDATVPKHQGLSYLFVPMKAEGISVRPLKQITGDEEFNEVFFDSVFTSDECLVGAAGKGWEIALSTLMYERAMLTFSRHLQSEQMLEKIGTTLRKHENKDAYFARYGQLVSRNMAMRALALSHLAHYSNGNMPGPEGSLDKLSWSETFQEICAFALEILGPDGIIEDGPRAHLDGFFQHQYLYSRGRTIAAGTSEIQRNIIAERVLGLGK